MRPPRYPFGQKPGRGARARRRVRGRKGAGAPTTAHKSHHRPLPRTPRFGGHPPAQPPRPWAAPATPRVSPPGPEWGHTPQTRASLSNLPAQTPEAPNRVALGGAAVRRVRTVQRRAARLGANPRHRRTRGASQGGRPRGAAWHAQPTERIGERGASPHGSRHPPLQERESPLCRTAPACLAVRSWVPPARPQPSAWPPWPGQTRRLPTPPWACPRAGTTSATWPWWARAPF